jgi:hypothetical protein
VNNDCSGGPAATPQSIDECAKLLPGVTRDYDYSPEQWELEAMIAERDAAAAKAAATKRPRDAGVRTPTDRPATLASISIATSVSPADAHGYRPANEKLLLQLEEKHGQPFVKSKKNIKLNQLFFASKFAAEHLILYEPTEKSFFTYRPANGRSRNDNHTSGVTTITHPWSGEACGLT